MSKHRNPHGRHSGPMPKLLAPLRLADNQRELTAEESLAAELISVAEALQKAQAQLEATEELLRQRSVEVANLTRVVALQRLGPLTRVQQLREQYDLPVNFSWTREETGRTVLTSSDAPAPEAPAPAPAAPEVPPGESEA